MKINAAIEPIQRELAKIRINEAVYNRCGKNISDNSEENISNQRIRAAEEAKMIKILSKEKAVVEDEYSQRYQDNYEIISSRLKSHYMKQLCDDLEKFRLKQVSKTAKELQQSYDDKRNQFENMLMENGKLEEQRIRQHLWTTIRVCNLLIKTVV